MEWLIYGASGIILLGFIIYAIVHKDDDPPKRPPSRWD